MSQLPELKELLGHADLKMTMRYAHLAPERLRTAVTKLDGLTPMAAVPSDSGASRSQDPLEEVSLLSK